MSTANRMLKRDTLQVAYVDKRQPGIVRFYDGDAFDGVLAGTRAQLIVDALNAYAQSQSGGKRRKREARDRFLAGEVPLPPPPERP